MPPYCEDKENLSRQRPRPRYSIVRRALPRSDNWTIHTQTPPIKRTNRGCRVVLICTRSADPALASLCVVSVNRSRLAPKPAPDGDFFAAPAANFFFQGGSRWISARRAVLPTACQTIEMLVKLTWSAQARAQPLWRARNSGGFSTLRAKGGGRLSAHGADALGEARDLA